MKDKSRKDGAVIRLRVTEPQEKAIKEMASEKGLSVSEYLRRAALVYGGRKSYP